PGSLHAQAGSRFRLSRGAGAQMVTGADATRESRVLGLFAELLDYPKPGATARAAQECRNLVVPESAEAAALLGEFAAFAERTSQDALEEIFTATFDLNASCHPYIGYHMFGEAYKRSALLLELKERFRVHGFDPGLELPDHLAVLLRFLAICDDAELRTEIVLEALLPTLEPMTVPPEPEPVEEGEEVPEVFDTGEDFRRVLHALRLVLQARYGMPAELEHIPMPDQELLIS
ncbi:MAG: nitrate reductase molybdenum cofactor assembly chaperone, partial [Vulcanimicrobiaceae bacterium]